MTYAREPQRCCEAVRSAILATTWLLVYSKDTPHPDCIDSVTHEVTARAMTVQRKAL